MQEGREDAWRRGYKANTKALLHSTRSVSVEAKVKQAIESTEETGHCKHAIDELSVQGCPLVDHKEGE